MPVYQVYAEMPYTELLNWVKYFKKRPIGWREDQRTFLLLQAQGYKGKPEDLFVTLKTMKENTPVETSALPKGKFLNMMLSAKDGDGSNWTPPWLGKK
jgi:hypothetical protein